MVHQPEPWMALRSFRFSQLEMKADAGDEQDHAAAEEGGGLRDQLKSAGDEQRRYL